MKNIFLVFIVLTIILAIFPSTTYADEVTTPEETSVVETTEEITDVTDPITEPEDKPVEDVTEAPTETHTEAPKSPDDGEAVSLLTRIQEAWEKGEITNVISLAFDAALIIFVSILKKSGGKNKVEMVAALKNTKDTTVKSVNDLIEAANNVVKAVEGEGGMKSIINGFKNDVNRQIEEIKEIDKDKLEGYGKELESTMAAVKLLADMLQTTYANSTTIPMSTKNIIGQKYVEICDLMKKETTNEQ
jgi:hypothetical protein